MDPTRRCDLRFGVRNDLTPWLEERGFRVPPDSHCELREDDAVHGVNHEHDASGRSSLPGWATDSSDHAPCSRCCRTPWSSASSRRSATATSTSAAGSARRASDPAADQQPVRRRAIGLRQRALRRVRRPRRSSSGSTLQTANPTFLRAYDNNRYALAVRSIPSRDKSAPEVRLRSHPAPAPALRVQSRWTASATRTTARTSPVNRSSFADQLAWTNDQLQAWITSLQALPEEQQADHHPPGRRGPVHSPRINREHRARTTGRRRRPPTCRSSSGSSTRGTSPAGHRSTTDDQRQHLPHAGQWVLRDRMTPACPIVNTSSANKGLGRTTSPTSPIGSTPAAKSARPARYRRRLEPRRRRGALWREPQLRSRNRTRPLSSIGRLLRDREARPGGGPEAVDRVVREDVAPRRKEAPDHRVLLGHELDDRRRCELASRSTNIGERHVPRDREVMDERQRRASRRHWRGPAASAARGPPSRSRGSGWRGP